MDLIAERKKVESLVPSLSETKEYGITSPWTESSGTAEWRRNLGLMLYQNDYNSPESQFERLVSAGVSPFAAAQSISGNVDSSASFSASDTSNQETMQKISLFSDLFQQSINFANQLVGLVNNGSNLSFNLDTYDKRLLNLGFQNDLLSSRAGISHNEHWLGSIRNAALNQAIGRGAYNGYGMGFDLGDLSLEELTGLTDYFKQYYDTRFAKLKGDELDYKIQNILPQILDKYRLDNSQKDYFMQVLETIPPEVRAYLVLGMELYSTLLKPFDFGNFVPKKLIKK